MLCLRQQSNASQIQIHNLIPIKFAYFSYSSYVRYIREKSCVSDFRQKNSDEFTVQDFLILHFQSNSTSGPKISI